MATIKVSINIASDEDPVVFEILCRIPKGVRRTNRAKQLMYLGAMVERSIASGRGPDTGAAILGQLVGDVAVDRSSGTAGAAEIFEPSVT